MGNAKKTKGKTRKKANAKRGGEPAPAKIKKPRRDKVKYVDEVVRERNELLAAEAREKEQMSKQVQALFDSYEEVFLSEICPSVRLGNSELLRGYYEGGECVHLLKRRFGMFKDACIAEYHKRMDVDVE